MTRNAKRKCLKLERLDKNFCLISDYNITPKRGPKLRDFRYGIPGRGIGEDNTKKSIISTTHRQLNVQKYKFTKFLGLDLDTECVR